MRKLFVLFFAIMFMAGCVKDEATNSNEDRVLTCGSTLEKPFQCISAAGKSTLTTYDIPELIGCWDSDDFDFCVKYNNDGTGLITFKPSAFVKGSTQKIKWGAMVNSKGELLLSNAGTIYIAHESLEGSLDPQIALLSFKRSSKQWFGFDLVSVGACQPVSGGGGSGTVGSKGDIIFWTKSDQGCGAIKVTVNGQTNTITQFFGIPPQCGQTGGASFSLPPGNYSFAGECTKYRWGPTPFTITAGSCLKLELK